MFVTHLNAPPLPGLGPEEEGGDAGHDAAEEAAEDAGLAQVLRVLVHQATVAAGPANAWT